MNGSKSPNLSTDKRPLKLCYLCGRPLSKPTSKDHCPPKALFAKDLRKRNVKLITNQVHGHCNNSYQRDEEYFIATMIPFARGSTAGNAIYKERISSFDEDGRNLRLGEKILREFEPRPGGLHLPTGLVIKRQEGVPSHKARCMEDFARVVLPPQKKSFARDVSCWLHDDPSWKTASRALSGRKGP